MRQSLETKQIQQSDLLSYQGSKPNQSQSLFATKRSTDIYSSLLIKFSVQLLYINLAICYFYLIFITIYKKEYLSFYYAIYFPSLFHYRESMEIKIKCTAYHNVGVKTIVNILLELNSITCNRFHKYFSPSLFNCIDVMLSIVQYQFIICVLSITQTIICVIMIDSLTRILILQYSTFSQLSTIKHNASAIKSRFFSFLKPAIDCMEDSDWSTTQKKLNVRIIKSIKSKAKF